MTPDQLTAYLRTRGLADDDGISRKARFRACPWCKKITLQGLDGDVAGLPVIADTQDLDRLAEAAEILTTGGLTYTVVETAERITLHPRFAVELRTEAQTRPVVRRHRCDNPPLRSSANRWRAPTHDPSLHTDAPPF